MVYAKTRFASITMIALVALTVAATARAEEANLFSVSPGGSISMASLGSLTFNTSLYRVTCPATLNGSWAPEYILAAPEAVMGNVTSGTMGACSSGSGRVDTTNPWAFTFSTFQGTLPNLTGVLVHIVDASFLLTQSVFGIPVNCKYTGTVGGSLALSGGGPYRTGLLSLLATGQTFTLDASLDTSGLCPPAESASVTGGFTFTSTTLTQLAYLGMDSIPVDRNFGIANGSQVFVFRNRSGGDITITRIALVPGTLGAPGFRLGDVNTCLTAQGGARTIANGAECRVRVDFTSSGIRFRLQDAILRLYRGAGGTTLTAYAGMSGR